MIRLTRKELFELIDKAFSAGIKNNKQELNRLKNLYPDKRSPTTIDEVINITCKEFNIDRAQFESQERSEYLIRPRAVAAYLICNHFKIKAPGMQKHFRKTHGSIHKLIKNFDSRYKTDHLLRQHYDNIVSKYYFET